MPASTSGTAAGSSSGGMQQDTAEQRELNRSLLSLDYSSQSPTS